MYGIAETVVLIFHTYMIRFSKFERFLNKNL